MTTTLTVRSGIVTAKAVVNRVLLLRAERVLLDSDLAALYGVETRAVVQAVKRNLARFPSDFAFQLTREEVDALRSHSVISSHGGRRYLPWAFTEQGVAMLSSVLRSPRAIAANVEIMRAFVRLRELLAGNTELGRKVASMEARFDKNFQMVFAAIRDLMQPRARRKRIEFLKPRNKKRG